MARVEIAHGTVPVLRMQMLSWYAASRRDLPWRHSRDPYAIWVSEIMLQQTRVAVVIDRYRVFLERFPMLQSLAEAPEQDVLALWSGLGYYRRARMLHKAARFVVAHGSGQLPQTAEELRTLPGIGAYTAAAIASIVHNERVAVVDGNVERVLCRLQGWDAPRRSGSTASRRKVEALATALVDPSLPGDFNQAMMELGATVCLPRNPRCMLCPLASMCDTRGEHPTAPRPRMLSKEVARGLTVRLHPASKVAMREVLLEQRPESESVMPGLWELPLLSVPDVPEQDLRMTVRHAIMQVNYYVRVRAVPEAVVDSMTVKKGERRWVSLEEVGSLALTGLARKILSRAHLLPSGQNQTVAARSKSGVV